MLNELCVNRQHESLLEMEKQHILCRSLLLNIIWLAQWTVKMNKILLCDWLLKRVGLCFLTQSGQPAVSRKEDFPEIHTINPLLTKLFGQDGSILASFLFILLMDLNSAYQWTRKIKNSAATQPSWPPTLLVNNPCIQNELRYNIPKIVLVWIGLINSVHLVNNKKSLDQAFSFCSVHWP